MPPHRLLILHQFDPRGRKVGGIETHVRHLMQYHPDDFSLVHAGVDELGDLPPGRIARIEVSGRAIDFLPVTRFPAEAISCPAKSLLQSLTLAYALGLLRHLPALRRALGSGPATVEVQRYEPAAIAALLRRPLVMVVHSEAGMLGLSDSPIARFGSVQRQSERVGLAASSRIVCVTERIRDRIGAVYPHHVAKTVVMPVPVDTAVFRPTPFETTDGVLRLAFVGRLEAVKDPGLLLATVGELARRLAGRIELHYVGTSDPADYGEFAAVARHVVLHGFQSPAGVARILARCHMGILTSRSEGMPCTLLEALAAGRPLAAIRLPQFDALVQPGVSGALVERQATQSGSAAAMADGILPVWRDIQSSRLAPEDIARLVGPFAITDLLPRHFSLHHEMHFGASVGPAAS